MNKLLLYVALGFLLTIGSLVAVRQAAPQTSQETDILPITMVTPPDGESVTGGELLEVTIEVTTSPAVRNVAIYCSGCDPTETDGGSPQRAQIRIPTDGRPELELLLVPFSIEGAPLLGTRVRYDVKAPPSVLLDSLSLRAGAQRIASGGVLDLEMAVAEELAVFGSYTDHRAVDITFSPETEISIEPASLARRVTTALDAPPWKQLTLQAQDYGVAHLAVRHGELRADFELRIGFSDVRGDLNRNRQLDAGDERIIRDAFGRPANPEDPRDLNRNGVIDKGDIDVLKSLSCGGAPDRSLVPGGGSTKTDCFGEFSLAGELLLDTRKCAPKNRQACTDGTPCDLDGTTDGACTFNTRLIFNHDDPRLPACSSPGIASVELLKPTEKDSEKNPDDAANRLGLLNALAGAGALPFVASLYTSDVDLRVRLKSSRKGPKKGSRTFKLRTTGIDGQKDTDTIVLECVPAYQPATPTPVPTASPTPTTVPTQTPTPSPRAPIINSVSSTVFTIGSGQQTLIVNGQNFVGDVVYLQSDSTDPPLGRNTSPTTATATRLTFNGPSGLDPTGWGALFPWAGTYYLQVETRVPGLFLRSNSVQIAVRNPAPVISSISGQCRAGLNCTLGNGFDVRINGSGFVSNATLGSVQSTKWYINGVQDSFSCISASGPTCSLIQVSLNATRIPTPGTYEIRACNVETASGEACATGQLTVAP